MRLIICILVALAVGLSAFSALTARQKLRSYEDEIRAGRAAAARIVPVSGVWVLNRPVLYGEKLLAGDVRLLPWPTASVPEGAFTEETPLFPPEGPAFRSVLRAMEKDEPVLMAKVTEPGVEAGISARLSPGLRAFAIQVDVQTGVSGLLRPGDRVDVYWTGQDASRGAVTRMIQASLQLIAVDQSADMDAQRTAIPRTVTVQATPEQVADLTQAQATGRLSLSLVGTRDSSLAAPITVRGKSLPQESAATPAPAEAVAPAARSCTVVTRRAGEKIAELSVPCPG